MRAIEEVELPATHRYRKELEFTEMRAGVIGEEQR